MATWRPGQKRPGSQKRPGCRPAVLAHEARVARAVLRRVAAGGARGRAVRVAGHAGGGAELRLELFGAVFGHLRADSEYITSPWEGQT